MARSYSAATDSVSGSITRSSNPYTLSGWFRDQGTGNGFSTVNVQSNSKGIWARPASRTISYFDETGGLNPATTYTTGTWNHVALTGNGTASQGYLNGAANGATFGTGVYVLGFGGQLNYTGSDFSNENLVGATADIAIWGVALTAKEILALSTGVRPYQIRPLSLLLWWPLDGLQSPEPDLSGNSHNGTVTGATLAAGPPVMPITPRWPQGLDVAGPVRWEIFMRHSMLPMLLVANPNMSRREALAALGLSGV